MHFSSRLVLMLAACASLHTPSFAVEAVKPARDDEVIEVLPAVTSQRPPAKASRSKPPAPGAAEAARIALQDISVARQTGDTRYWGRAQSVLAPWWDKPDAPADLAVLQATVQQGRHEFDTSRVVLTATLARTPGHAQGWLNLASLERLSGRYAESLVACEAVGRAGQGSAALYAEACRLETASLQGRQAQAVKGFQALLDQTRDAGQRSWLLSLAAENLERYGQDAAAARAYAASLAAEHDLYTAIAFSDLLLRTGKNAEALKLLTPLPATDAVVLRMATAHKRLGDTGWQAERAVLTTRVDELRRRGDDVGLHGRELALAALWLDEDAPAALAFARTNLRLQREPVDWWVALKSARLANDSAALAELQGSLKASGLQDVRLMTQTLAPAGAGKGAGVQR
ncbi:MAG: hypothetical protein EOO28_00190 [Comamonadaceae bacterium]|nr:MAG: hypothetical protein EOO28_00190 [Comamonadaceae bacterium]